MCFKQNQCPIQYLHTHTHIQYIPGKQCIINLQKFSSSVFQIRAAIQRKHSFAGAVGGSIQSSQSYLPFTDWLSSPLYSTTTSMYSPSVIDEFDETSKMADGEKEEAVNLVSKTIKSVVSEQKQFVITMKKTNWMITELDLCEEFVLNHIVFVQWPFVNESIFPIVHSCSFVFAVHMYSICVKGILTVRLSALFNTHMPYIQTVYLKHMERNRACNIIWILMIFG